MKDLKSSTKVVFKELYNNYHELIEYRINSGNIYEKAQATLIKSVAFGDLQAPDCLEAYGTCKTVSGAPLPNQIRNDSP
jgi:hypothetical protein